MLENVFAPVIVWAVSVVTTLDGAEDDITFFSSIVIPFPALNFGWNFALAHFWVAITSGSLYVPHLGNFNAPFVLSELL